jgi:hypothetical protein
MSGEIMKGNRFHLQQVIPNKTNNASGIIDGVFENITLPPAV